ncbi:hypothetical protein IX51_05815 [uncultured archaeon]|nr:hypothetical protein IX51_05815 [uncultured archaeon]
MSLSSTITIGGHVSAAGGPSNAPGRASVFSFNTFQIFSKNQMQWKSKPLPEEEIKRFADEVKSHSMRNTMVHASYLLNLGTSDPSLKEKALNGMKVELERIELLGMDLLTFHPGSSKGITEKESLKNIAEALNQVLFKEQKSKILLETAAGQGSNVGYNFEQLAEIIDQISLKDKVGICFDTCHVWASGYDIKSPEGYAETMDSFDSTLGLDRLNGFHLNDSKKGTGSRVDRHEQIGQGTLGMDGISNFVNDRRFRNVPMILETPRGEEGYDEDLKVIRGVFQEER